MTVVLLHLPLSSSSKLTLHSDCCTAVGSCRGDLPALCSLLTLHKDKPVSTEHGNDANMHYQGCAHVYFMYVYAFML